jgi:hypothetical protein
MNDASLQREITDLACDLIAFASTADHPIRTEGSN